MTATEEATLDALLKIRGRLRRREPPSYVTRIEQLDENRDRALWPNQEKLLEFLAERHL